MKRMAAFFITILVFISLNGKVAFACDESQTNIYVTQILFGDAAFSKTTDENVKMLMYALYLCSEQADNQGQEKIDYLKSKRVSEIPSLTELNINGDNLLECSHNTWEYKSAEITGVQEKRRKVLRNTVNKVFDFGFINNLFKGKNGSCNSFAALLYYSHILADYLADDPTETEVNVNGKTIPPFSGQPYSTINGDKPFFTKEQKKQTISFANYSQLDSLGRAGVAFGNIGKDIMPPSNSRQQIGMIKPSGWNQKKYKEIIGTESTPGYIFQRLHLIAHQLAGEDGPNNLITGTDYLNNKGMGAIEGDVAEYVRKTGNHVLYRVTPIYKGDNKVASGVQIEAFSVEDGGDGICVNRYYYNVQPGIDINYINGDNQVSDTLFSSEGCLLFSVKDASDSNPDLLYCIKHHLEILFKNQKSSTTYTSMMDRIDMIANEARNLSDNNKNQYYVNLKQYQYMLFETLKSYVPLLLSEESFFKSAFK